MILLEVGNLDGLVIIFVSIMVIPPIILTIIGLSIRKNYKKGALVLYILAALYLLIGLGICGAIS